MKKLKIKEQVEGETNPSKTSNRFLEAKTISPIEKKYINKIVQEE